MQKVINLEADRSSCVCYKTFPFFVSCALNWEASVKDSFSENGSFVGKTWLKPGPRPRNPDAMKCCRACWEPLGVTYAEKTINWNIFWILTFFIVSSPISNYLSGLEVSGISFPKMLSYLSYFCKPECINELVCRWGLAPPSLEVTASSTLESSKSFWKRSWHFYYLKLIFFTKKGSPGSTCIQFSCHLYVAGGEDTGSGSFAAHHFTLPVPFLNCANVLDGHWGEPHTRTCQSEWCAPLRKLRSHLAVTKMKRNLLISFGMETATNCKFLDLNFKQSFYLISFALSFRGCRKCCKEHCVWRWYVHFHSRALPSSFFYGPLRMIPTRWLKT